MAPLPEKTVLFLRTEDGKEVRQAPIAAFSSPQTANSYAVVLHTAIASNSPEQVKSLWPAYPFKEDGALRPKHTFSMVTIPHNPQPAITVPGLEVPQS